jgi:hypothetical protein
MLGPFSLLREQERAHMIEYDNNGPRPTKATCADCTKFKAPDRCGAFGVSVQADFNVNGCEKFNGKQPQVDWEKVVERLERTIMRQQEALEQKQRLIDIRNARIRALGGYVANLEEALEAKQRELNDAVRCDYYEAYLQEQKRADKLDAVVKALWPVQLHSTNNTAHPDYQGARKVKP